MGLWDTVKGWFNIGGVSVKLRDVNPMVPKSGNRIDGKVVLSSKSDKHVLKMHYKFVLERSTGRGNERETKEFVFGEATNDQPFDIKTGETKTLDFTIPYSLSKELKDMGGALGTLGKLGAFAANEKDDYYVIAVCDVKGTPFDPRDKVRVQVVD
jgi:hypothetical protein